MTPIERMTVRSEALSILGVAGNASFADIRAAYRKLVFEKHPDRGNGSNDEFVQISAAYQILEKTTDNTITITPKRPTARTFSRPTVQATESHFTDVALSMCDALHREDARQGLERHVATRLVRNGRSLTYTVQTRPAKGLNKVVVPTCGMVNPDSAAAKSLTIRGTDIRDGIYEVTESDCQRLFPGARRVRIQFV